MQATELLMQEHRVIEGVILSLERAADDLETGKEVRPGFFLDAAQFIQGFVDGCHHRKEEEVLFKAMVANGIPGQAGPIPVMLYEHEQGRAFNRGLREAAERLAVGDMAARAAIVQNARNYAGLLRQHIVKEDSILYPLAERALSPEQQDQVLADFEHVEHEETGAGVHEKYLSLAHALEKEAGR
jgi:hemerythrin-like domain-containing protein